MIWKIFTGFLLSAVIIAVFLMPPPQKDLGDVSRIFFFHVPVAWVAVLAFFVSMVNSIFFLRRGDMLFDTQAASAARLGFLFCILALITGTIFAKNTWGSFWNWDPRETSIVILLMIYGAYFALRSAVPDPEKKRVFAAVYSILAFVTVPFLVFIVPRITASLHPEDTMNPANPGMDAKTLKVFLGSLLAYTALFVWMLHLRMRILQLEERREAERRRQI